MYLHISFLCLLSSIALVVCQPALTKSVVYDIPPPNESSITLELVIAANGASVDTVEIIELESGANASASCTYDYATLNMPLAGFRTINLVIDAITGTFSTAGKETCPVSEMTIDGGFTFRLRFREVAGTTSASDSIFVIQTIGIDQTAVSVSPQPPLTIVSLETGNYNVELAVWDINDTPVANAVLGTSAKLMFKMTIDPYQDLLSYAGAFVHSCSVDRDNSFTNSPIQLTDQDGCVTENPIIRGTGGVEKSDTLSELQTATVYVFVAESPLFGVKGFANEPELFFKCYFTPCFNDTGNSCGVNSCGTSGRKKREVSETDAVTTSITINRPKPAGKQCTCPDPTLWYGSLGGLCFLAAMGFVVMITLFLDLQRSTKLSSSSQSAMRSRERRTQSTAPHSVPASESCSA